MKTVLSTSGGKLAIAEVGTCQKMPRGTFYGNKDVVVSYPAAGRDRDFVFHPRGTSRIPSARLRQALWDTELPRAAGRKEPEIPAAPEPGSWGGGVGLFWFCKGCQGGQHRGLPAQILLLCGNFPLERLLHFLTRRLMERGRGKGRSA